MPKIKTENLTHNVFVNNRQGQGTVLKYFRTQWEAVKFARKYSRKKINVLCTVDKAVTYVNGKEVFDECGYF